MPGCGSAWLERLVWDQEVAGSNPVTPTEILNFIKFICGCSSMVEHQPSKLDTWVRFPSPAFHLQIIMESIICGNMFACEAGNQLQGRCDKCVRSSAG